LDERTSNRRYLEEDCTDDLIASCTRRFSEPHMKRHAASTDS
jgi:hypothetical protein